MPSKFQQDFSLVVQQHAKGIIGECVETNIIKHAIFGAPDATLGESELRSRHFSV
jgi:hypothetical protein